MPHLPPVGFGVTVQKEILQGIACRSAFGAGRHRAHQDIIGSGRAGGAEGFDALVVAVAGSASVADDTEFSRLSPQQDSRGVDVARFCDRRIHQAAGGGEDLRGLFSQQPSRHIEVMNRHVLEKPAGHADVGHRRRSRIVTYDVQALELTDGIRLDPRFKGREVRIEATVEAEQHDGAGQLWGSLTGARQIQVQRFLAENLLAGGSCEQGLIQMRIRRAGNDDPRNGRIAQCRIHGHHSGGGLTGKRFAGRAVRIDDIFERQFRQSRGVARVNLADPSGAENREVDHNSPVLLARLRSERAFEREYNEMLTFGCVTSLNPAEKTLDLIAVGRSSVDLYGEQVGGRLEDMASFAKYVGGSPTNTAIAAARLGLRTGLLTRVGADHMGRFIREQLIREGVDVRGVHSDPERLTALVVLGIRTQDSFPLIFYRENCADMALCEQDLDDAYLRSARAVLINGTHLSTHGVFAASLGAARRVKADGGKVVFDVDYRPVLWGLTAKDLGENRFVADARVTERLQAVLPISDLIVGTEEELCILGGCVDLPAAIKNIRARTSATLVCKRGPDGCVAFAGDIPNDLDAGLLVPGFKVKPLNVLGAGDAFMGGFLRGWLRGDTLEECCRFGNACGAIVVSRHGCAPEMPTWAELQLILSTRGELPNDSLVRQLDHVHWASTRYPDYAELLILAIDHRSQFEESGDYGAVDAARVAKFKTLGLRALDAAARKDRRFGVLLDGTYGAEALSEAADLPYWVGRPIEKPKSRPLEFEGGADVGAEILSWPLNQVVKCLVIYHPDDPADLRGRQDRQLKRLYGACRSTRHELLLEIIHPRELAVDANTTARAMRQIYALGVRPDWWKLPPNANAEVWQAVQDTITAEDPLCRGVVLLGLSAPEAELIAAFAAAAPFESVKGFAIGRTVFHEVARAWFNGSLRDDDATEAMTSKFLKLANAWHEARAAVAV